MTNGIQQRKQLDFLNQKIAEYNQTYQKYPNRIQDLTDSGLIAPSQLPSDPFGGQYYIDAGTHQARSTKEYYLGVYRPKAFEK